MSVDETAGVLRTAREHTAPPVCDLLNALRAITPIPRPRVESISVHPLDFDRFRELFADGSTSRWMGAPMFGVPVLADDAIWRGNVRVRVDGEDRTFPLPLPPRWIPADGRP